MIPKWRPFSPKSWPPTFFAPIVNWITFTGASPGQCALTGWREPISMSGGWQGRLALYCAGGLVFCARLIGGDAARTAHVEKMPVGLSEAIAVATRFGHWRQKKAASARNTPRPLESSLLLRSSTLIDRTGPSFSRRRRRDQLQTWTGRTCQPERECTRRRTV